MKLMFRAPWYYGWNIVVAGMASQAIIFGIILYSFTFWIAPWTEEFDVKRAEVMTIYVLIQVISALFSPIAGRALDRFRTRHLMLIAAICFALSLFLSSIANQLWQIGLAFGTFMVVGMVWAGTIPASALVAKWFDRRRGMAMGICTIGTSIGGFLIPPLMAWLQQEYGWRSANQILAALAIVVIGLAALTVFDTPEMAGIEHEGRADVPSKAGKEEFHREWAMAEVLKSRTFWCLGISFLLVSFATTAILQNLAPMGNDAGIKPTSISLYVSILALVMIFAKLGVGYLADRISYRLILTVVVTLIALSITILAFFGLSSVSILFAVILLGLGMGGLLPLFGLIVADIFGLASFGRVQGMLILVMLPASLGAVMAAAIYDRLGSYQLALIILLIALTPTVFLIRGIAQKSS